MSRHGYSDDLDQRDLAMYRGAVMKVIRGKRGQSLLKDLAVALDALPVKELQRGLLVSPDGPCALGCLGQAKGIPVELLDPEDPDAIAAAFDVNRKLICEIEYINDEFYGNAPAARFKEVREWVGRNIKDHDNARPE